MTLDSRRAQRVEKLLAGAREGHSQASDLPPRSRTPDPPPLQDVRVVAGAAHRGRGRHRQSSVRSSEAGDSCPTHKIDNERNDQYGSKNATDVHVILR